MPYQTPLTLRSSTCQISHYGLLENESDIEDTLSRTGYRLDQGALAGETKRRVFQILCEMQRGLESLHTDYTKERNKREQGHSFGVWRHSATKRKCC